MQTMKVQIQSLALFFDTVQYLYSIVTRTVSLKMMQKSYSEKNNPDISGILFITDTDTVAESKENTLCTNSNSKKKLMWHW